MRKVLHFASPRQKYTCDAVIVWCYDNRFEAAFRKLLKRMNIVHQDPIRLAGGAKCLAAPELESERQFVLEQIHKSVQLHRTRLAILMLHSDCGAYGGLKAYKSAEEEARHHTADLLTAAAFVKKSFPALTVKTFLVNFEGVWDVDPAAAENEQNERNTYRYDRELKKVVEA